MLYEAVSHDRLKFNKHNGQKDILPNFGLSYKPQTAEYKINDEYSVLFIKTKDKNWENYLSKDGLTLYEVPISSDPEKLQIKNRLLKRITFLNDVSSTYGGGYSFIGVFVLDQSYDWKTDTYPTGKPMIPRLKYNRILDMIDTESFRK